ncbi:MAG: hypothetical protein JO217_13900 [Acidobacteriaceae bacterium]|nr:hypothetical protein [Acidobacteriaceae bacterium]
MNLGLHAERILKAWQQIDIDSLHAELESVEGSLVAFSPVSSVSAECAELLRVAVERLRSIVRCEITPARHHVEPSLNLLRQVRLAIERDTARTPESLAA